MNFQLKIISVLLAVIYSNFVSAEITHFIVAGTLILIFGIPHGASDPLIFNFISNRDINKQPPKKFLFIYGTLIGAYLILWLLMPLPSFIFFLVLSAYHFGEAQFVGSGKIRFKKSLAFIWGSALLLLLFLPHIEILQSWLLPIVKDKSVFSWLEHNNQLISLISIVVLIASVAIFHQKIFVKEFIELIALLILFNHASILISFAVFFTIWHSHDSLQSQFAGIKQSQKGLRFSQYIKKLSPFSLMSVLSLVVFTLIAHYLKLEISWIISFFILIALITLPHSLIIHNFYKKLKLY